MVVSDAHLSQQSLCLQQTASATVPGSDMAIVQATRMLLQVMARAGGEPAARAAKACARAAIAAENSTRRKGAAALSRQQACIDAGDILADQANARIARARAAKLIVTAPLQFSMKARTEQWPANKPPPLLRAEMRKNLNAFKRRAARLKARADRLQLSAGQSHKAAAAEARRIAADTAEKAAAMTSIIDCASFKSVASWGEAEALLEEAASADAVAASAASAAARVEEAAKIAGCAAGQVAVKGGLAATHRNESDAGQPPEFVLRMMTELVSLTTAAASMMATNASNRLMEAAREVRDAADYCRWIARLHDTMVQLLQDIVPVIKSVAAAEARRTDLLSILAWGAGRGRAA